MNELDLNADLLGLLLLLSGHTSNFGTIIAEPAPFKEISGEHSDQMVDLIRECADLVDADFSEVKVKYIPRTAGKMAYYTPNGNAFGFADILSVLDRDSAKFIVLHEMRHLMQQQRGLTSDITLPSGEYVFCWKGEPITSSSEIEKLMEENDGIEYLKLPWEADANGFARSIMSDYVPIDESFANAIKFATTPE